MTGVFDRGRSGSDTVWRTPTELARHADRSTVPLRECFADVFKDAHHENDDPFHAVDADEMERVYDSLAKSERIVGGYTRFGFVDKGARKVYCTADPDAVEETRAVTQGALGVPFGNPLFRAEGELFDNKTPFVRVGTNLDVRDAPLASQRLGKTQERVIRTRNTHELARRTRNERQSGTPSTSNTSAPLFASSSNRRSASAATATARPQTTARPGFPLGFAAPPRQPMFPSMARPCRPPSHSNAPPTHAALKRPRSHGHPRGRPNDSPIRPPLDPEKRALVEQIQFVLSEVRARIRGESGGFASVPAKTTNRIGTRFAAVSVDRTGERGERRRAAIFEALARPALAWWRSFAKHASAKREEELFAKALGAFTLKTTKTALSRWMEFVAESFEMRALVTGAVGRFVSRTAHAALARWLAWTIDRGERRTLAKRAVSWRMGHLKTAALERWYAWCNDRKEQRALVKTAVYWRMGRVKTETVLRWRDALVDAQTARWALRFFADRTKSAAFALWAEFADRQRDARREDTHALTHWATRAARLAMTTWSERARAAWEDRLKLQRAIAACASTARSRAFLRWATYVTWQVQSRELRRVAETHFAGRTGTAAFTKWVDFTHDARLGKEKENKATRHFKSRALVAGVDAFANNLELAFTTRRAVGLWIHQTTGRALRRWHDFCAERAAATALDPVAFSFFRKGLLKNAVARWRRNALRQLLAREEWALAVDRFRHTALHRVWPTWIQHVKASIAREDADEHRARVVAREVITKWRLETRVSLRRRENVRARFIKAWFRFSKRRAVLRSLLFTVRLKRYAKTTRDAFHTWSSVWLAEAKATLGLALTQRGQTRRVVKSWRQVAAGSRVDREKVATALLNANAKRQAKAFHALSSHWARKVLTRSFVYGRQKSLARKAWQRWAHLAWETRLRLVEDTLGAVEAFNSSGSGNLPLVEFRGFETARTEASDVSPSRGFSMSHSPSNGPWLGSGPGLGKSKASMGDRDKWKYY